jgi:hypothetical protein
MFNVTNVELSMCVTVYSDLFWILDLTTECMSLSGYYLNGEESLRYSHTSRKDHNNTRMAGKALRKQPLDWLKLA